MRFVDLTKPLVDIFRRAPPSPPTLATRVAALDEGSSELIAATATGHGEEALRSAAVRKLADGTTLRKLAGLSEGAAATAFADVERVAQERVAQLIDSGSIDFAGLCAVVGNTTALLSVAGLCSDPAHLAKTLASIEGGAAEALPCLYVLSTEQTTLEQGIAHRPGEASRAEARLVHSSSPGNRAIKARPCNI